MQKYEHSPKGVDDALREGVPIEELSDDAASAFVDEMAKQSGLPPDDDERKPSDSGQKKADPKKVKAALDQLVRPLTQLGNAERLAERHGQDIRYCVGVGWYVFDGTHWQRDDANLVQELAKETVRAIPQDIKKTTLTGMSDKDIEAVKEELAGWAKGSETQKMVTAMLSLASSDRQLVVTPAQLDADPYAFNVENGTLVFTPKGDVTLKPHDRADLITRVAPVAYDNKAVSEPVNNFLWWVCNERPDLLFYLLRVLGSCLLGVVREHVFHVWHGPGRNGKGVTLRLMQKLLGEYATTADPRTFMDSGGKADGAAHKEDIARLQGRRLVSAEEANRGHKLDVARIKTLTGGDIQSARLPYAKHSIEFKPEFTLIVATNNKPYLPPDDRAAWARIRLFPFDAVATEEMRAASPTFEDDLAASGLAGLLNLLVEACQEWLRHGLEPPPEVMEATEGYRNEVDVVGACLKEAFLVGEDLSVSAAQAYRAFQDWAKEAGEREIPKRKFLQELRTRGYQEKQVGHSKTLTFFGLEPRPDYTCVRRGESLPDTRAFARPWGSDKPGDEPAG